MKKSILFVLFALISVAGFSQITGWNAKVGMNFSNYTGDLDMNAKVGFKLGGGFEYAFDDTWSLQPSLFLTSKGACAYCQCLLSGTADNGSSSFQCR